VLISASAVTLSAMIVCARATKSTLGRIVERKRPLVPGDHITIVVSKIITPTVRTLERDRPRTWRPKLVKKTPVAPPRSHAASSCRLPHRHLHHFHAGDVSADPQHVAVEEAYNSPRLTSPKLASGPESHAARLIEFAMSPAAFMRRPELLVNPGENKSPNYVLPFSALNIPTTTHGSHRLCL